MGQEVFADGRGYKEDCTRTGRPVMVKTSIESLMMENIRIKIRDFEKSINIGYGTAKKSLNVDFKKSDGFAPGFCSQNKRGLG